MRKKNDTKMTTYQFTNSENYRGTKTPSPPLLPQQKIKMLGNVPDQDNLYKNYLDKDNNEKKSSFMVNIMIIELLFK